MAHRPPRHGGPFSTPDRDRGGRDEQRDRRSSSPQQDRDPRDRGPPVDDERQSMRSRTPPRERAKPTMEGRQRGRSESEDRWARGSKAFTGTTYPGAEGSAEAAAPSRGSAEGRQPRANSFERPSGGRRAAARSVATPEEEEKQMAALLSARKYNALGKLIANSEHLLKTAPLRGLVNLMVQKGMPKVAAAWLREFQLQRDVALATKVVGGFVASKHFTLAVSTGRELLPAWTAALGGDGSAAEGGASGTWDLLSVVRAAVESEQFSVALKCVRDHKLERHFPPLPLVRGLLGQKEWALAVRNIRVFGLHKRGADQGSGGTHQHGSPIDIAALLEDLLEHRLWDLYVDATTEYGFGQLDRRALFFRVVAARDFDAAFRLMKKLGLFSEQRLLASLVQKEEEKAEAAKAEAAKAEDEAGGAKTGAADSAVEDSVAAGKSEQPPADGDNEADAVVAAEVEGFTYGEEVKLQSGLVFECMRPNMRPQHQKREQTRIAQKAKDEKREEEDRLKRAQERREHEENLQAERAAAARAEVVADAPKLKASLELMSDLVKAMVEAKVYNTAMRFALRYGLTEQFPPRELIGRMIRAGQYQYALKFMDELDMRHRFKAQLPEVEAGQQAQLLSFRARRRKRLSQLEGESQGLEWLQHLKLEDGRELISQDTEILPPASESASKPAPATRPSATAASDDDEVPFSPHRKRDTQPSNSVGSGVLLEPWQLALGGGGGDDGGGERGGRCGGGDGGGGEAEGGSTRHVAARSVFGL